MRGTSNFKTKTSFIERNNGRMDGIWEIAIDLGYSAVKLFAPNKISRFPSYAKRVEENFAFAGEVPASSILYRDGATGEVWLVGEYAQNLMSDSDTTDSEASLYGRERYGNTMFRVIAETGLGIGLMGNSEGTPASSDRIVVQTGLPEQYMGDKEALTDFLAGDHSFSIKIAGKDWEDFHFSISSNDIDVMSQPKGTLFSVCINKDGRFHPDARKYLSSSVIVFDAGFGTLDLFPIRSGAVGKGETYSDLGMKRVLQETSRGIRDEFHVEIPVPAMQKYLATGKIRYMDRKNFKSKEYEFGDILAAASAHVCEEAIMRTADVLDLLDYNYMIITGGTGAAWFNQIQDKFRDFDTLKIIQGNQNDDLPFVYANVRGYYFYRYNKLGRK